MQPPPEPEPEPETEEPELEETRTLGDIAVREEQDLPGIERRLAQGADLNDAAEYQDGWIGSYRGVAPLWLAARNGHVEMVDALVDALADAGADLGWKTSIGQTALHRAASNGHAGAVRSLATRGGRAAVDARDNGKQTPLEGHRAAAQELLETGADASLKAAAARPRWIPQRSTATMSQ